MEELNETSEVLNAALSRVISGNTTCISPDRKLSVAAVEAEAGLGNGSAYYYPEIICKIRKIIKLQRSNQGGTLPKTSIQKYKDEKLIKEKYREQVSELRKQVSNMATEHHQFYSELIRAKKEIKNLKDQIAKSRRERIGVVKPSNTTFDT